MSTPHPVMTALARRMPLTLLLDLYDEEGPDSRGILSRELGDLSWLRDLAYGTRARVDGESAAEDITTAS